MVFVTLCLATCRYRYVHWTLYNVQYNVQVHCMYFIEKTSFFLSWFCGRILFLCVKVFCYIRYFFLKIWKFKKKLFCSFFFLYRCLIFKINVLFKLRLYLWNYKFFVVLRFFVDDLRMGKKRTSTVYFWCTEKFWNCRLRLWMIPRQICEMCQVGNKFAFVFAFPLHLCHPQMHSTIFQRLI